MTKGSIIVPFIDGTTSNLPTKTEVFLIDSEKNFAENLKKGIYKEIMGGLYEYYYRPVNIPEGYVLRHIEVNPYQIIFSYSKDLKDLNNDISYLWFYTQNGDSWVENSVKSYGKVHVYPDKAEVAVDLNRDEAKKLERTTWDVDWCKDGNLFKTNIIWTISDEDVINYLQMEKVNIFKIFILTNIYPAKWYG